MKNLKNMLLESKIVPVQVWDDADKLKLEILEENRGKSGIYMWQNKLSGKIYVGSAKNIRNRLMVYYNINSLVRATTMAIYRAILKWGYSSFSFSVLEYCEIEDLIQREQYYIDTLKPEYNIAPTAGSTLGRLHSEKAKEKISNTKKNTNVGEDNHFFGEVHTEKARQRMSEVKLGGKIAEATRLKIGLVMKGKKFSAEHIAALSRAKSNSKKLSVLDLETGIETIYASIGEATRTLGVPKASLQANLKSKSKLPYRGRYVLKLVE